jgi:outer membrane protein OmpA-like peptidoglycan-associated protein
MRLFTCFLIFLSFVGCASQRTAPTAPAAAPLSAACQKQNRIGSLQQGGVQVVQVGDELRFILPDKRLFVKNTTLLQTTAYMSLNEIVALLNQQRNLGIQVLAYTVSRDDLKPNVSLAQQQAQAVVDYFLRHGLNTRLITANAWKGLSARQKQGTGRFSDDAPVLFSVEVRTRLLQPEDVQ